MVGIDGRTGKVLQREDHIKQSIDIGLHTPIGSRPLRRHVGVDFLDERGLPLPNLAPASVEASVHALLTEYETRITLDAVTAHFDGSKLTSIRVGYRDREDGSMHEVAVSYG